MNGDTLTSPLLESAVTELSRLPGLGRKTALRLALHLLRRDATEAEALGNAIINLRRGIRYCSRCHNISDTELCPICADPRRDATTICVVESIKDVMVVERTGIFRGLYHVLGGVISPLEGIGPDRLEIASLAQRVADDPAVREVILALSATMEGDTTGYYIYRMLPLRPGLSVSQLARGVTVGNNLEYTDEITLGRSLMNRTPFGDATL